MDLRNVLNTTYIAARVGGKELRRWRADNIDLKSENKADGTLVTAADRAASAAITSYIKGRDPSAFILDEEREALHTLARPESMWVIDPLDGTHVFANGGDDFCTMVAYVQQGIPVIGAIYFPMIDLTVFGGKRVGAWVKPSETMASPLISRRVQDLSQSQLAVPKSRSARPIYERIIHAWGVRPYWHNCSGGMYADLLRGSCDLVVSRPGHPSIWDVAAGHAILLAIGGSVTDLKGNPLDYPTDVKLTRGHLAVIDPNLTVEALAKLPPYATLCE